MKIDVCLSGVNLYILKALCVIDIAAYFTVFLDRFTWWARAVAVVNVAFLSMVLMRALSPDPDLVSADVIYSSGGFGLVVLLGYLLRSAVGGFVLTAVVAFFGVGVGLQVAEANAANIAEYVGMDDSDMTRFLLAGSVILIFFVVAFFVYVATQTIIVIMRAILFSVLFTFAFRTLALNDGLLNTSELCCDSDSDTDTCPFAIDEKAVYILCGALSGRLLMSFYDRTARFCYAQTCCSCYGDTDVKQQQKKVSDTTKILLLQNQKRT